MEQKCIAESLVRKYKTRDPFRIASELGYVVIRTPLYGIRGFCQRMKRRRIIYIDSNLSDHVSRFVCAHEIGHLLMHQRYNRIFMDTNTYFLVNRQEVEASRFAVDLLFDDEYLQDFLEYPIQIAADCMGVSTELAEYRMQSVKHN